jgi:hypothetical protein
MRRILVVLFATAALALLALSSAAAPPDRGTFAFEADNPLTDLCPFTIQVHSAVSGRWTAYLDKNGVLTRVQQHVFEVDTYAANGKSLTGLPITFNFNMRFDSAGNLTSAVSTGVGAHVALPDGSFFHSAGRIDFFALGMPGFWITPDNGSLVNVEGFCAALAP